MELSRARTFGALTSGSKNNDDERPVPKRKSIGRRLLRVLLHLVFWPVLLITLIAVLIYVPPVQNLIRKKAVTFLQEKTGTEVQLGHFALRFPIGVSLEGLYVEGQDGDTLLYAGDVKARLGLTALTQKKILLGGVELKDVRATVIQRADSAFNFQFVIDGFASKDTVNVAPKEKGGKWDFSVKDVLLKNIVLDLELEPSHLELDLHLGELSINMDDLDLAKKRYYVDELQLSDTKIAMRTRSSPPEPNEYPALTNPLDSLDIRFQELGLKNVSFTMKTTNTGDSLWMYAGEVEAIADAMDLTEQQASLDKLALNEFTFGMLKAIPDTTEKLKEEPIWLDQNDGFRFFIRDWNITAKTVSINESEFAMHTSTVSDAQKLFDPEHLVVKKIELELNDLTVNNKNIAAAIDKLKAINGPKNTPLEVSLKLDATPERFAITDGSVTAGGNAISFEALAEQGELARIYRDPKTIPLKLKASSELDIARLKPLLETFDIEVPNELTTDEVLAMNVNVRGTLQTLDTIALVLDGDQGSLVRLKGRIANASDWPRSTFALDIEQITMGAGIRQVVRLFTPQGTVLPERFTLVADATGANGSMRANIDMDSDLGSVRGKIGVDDWRDSIPEAINIDLDVDRFRVSAFMKDTAIAPISARIKGSGTQINSPNRVAHLEVLPKKLRYQGNDLSSLKIVADALRDSIHANITLQAEPIDLVLNAHGTWPNKGDSLTARFDVAVNTLKLQALGLMDRALNFNGNLNGRAAFNPDGYGSFELNADSLRMANNERDFQFDRFLAKGLLNTDSTAFEIESDAITLAYHTNVPIDSLLPRTREKLTSLFTADTAFIPTRGKRMDFAITLPRTEWLTGLLVPELQAIQLENFSGTYDSDSNVIDLNIDMPYLAYDSIRVENLYTTIKAERSVLNGDITIAHIQRDSLYIDGLEVKARTDAGALITTLRVEPEDSTEQYLIGVVLRNVEKIRTLHVQEKLVLDHIKWEADSTNLLHFEPEGMRAENFVLRSEDQRLELKTGPDALHVLLGKFRLATLTNLVSTMDSVPVATGVIDADVVIPRGENGLLKAAITINDLTTLGTPIGTLTLNADQRNSTTYDGSAKLSNSQNKLDANARITTGENNAVRAEADIDLGNISFLKPFVSDFLYALNGGIKGKVRYEQQGNRTQMEGNLDFNNAAVGVIMTGATYTLKNERLVLSAENASLKDFTLTDSLGNKFELNGDIGLKNMAEPTLDLTVQTDKFQMISSTFDQNQLFYGDLFASTDLTVTGSAKKPLLKGTVGILSGTDFSVVLPGSKVELVKAEGVVVFTDNLSAYDTLALSTDGEVLRDSLMANLPGVELDLRILIDNGAQFAVVLDPTTGDEATFRGNGDLTFRYSPKGDIYLKGPFTIEEGGYTLEFYGLVKKRFDLVKGSSVRWYGDPLDATMAIKAQYISESAPYPLVASSSSGIADVERNRLQQPLPFEVVISVDGAIKDPKIDFGIDMERDLRNSYPKVSSKLEQLAQTGNSEERNRQVFGLLVLNSFIQDEASGGAPSSGIASSAARNSVNGLLTDQLNKLSGKYIKGVNIQLGVNTYDQASGNQTYQRTSVDYKVSKSILNDRLSFEVGGSLGVNESNSQVSNVSNTRAAQYAILYDLTKDGRFRIRGFHENAYDLYDGEITNSGVALMYTKEFEENERGRIRDRERIRREESEDNKK